MEGMIVTRGCASLMGSMPAIAWKILLGQGFLVTEAAGWIL